MRRNLIDLQGVMFSVYSIKGQITWSGLGPFVNWPGYLYCHVITKLNNPANPGNECESWILLCLPKVPRSRQNCISGQPSSRIWPQIARILNKWQSHTRSAFHCDELSGNFHRDTPSQWKFFRKNGLSLEFVFFDGLIRSGWNVPRFLYINFCFQSHTHEKVTKTLFETWMEFFKETAGKFLWIEQCRSICLEQMESTAALLGTVSISVQPLVLLLNSIFRSYIPPFWILFTSCYSSVWFYFFANYTTCD